MVRVTVLFTEDILKLVGVLIVVAQAVTNYILKEEGLSIYVPNMPIDH